MKRVAEVHEIASVVLFLCSDQASFVTGESVNVDGGILALGGWAAHEGAFGHACAGQRACVRGIRECALAESIHYLCAHFVHLGAPWHADSEEESKAALSVGLQDAASLKRALKLVAASEAAEAAQAAE
jgi:hypothetical protein